MDVIGNLASTLPNSLQENSANMSILLVFPREESQSLCFVKAAERLSITCDTAATAESAMEKFISERHDLVIIDRRPSSAAFEPDRLLASMRSVIHSEMSCFVAVTRQSGSRNNLPMNELIDIGFDLKFQEHISIDASSDFLLSCRHNFTSKQHQQSCLLAAFAALDRVGDAVEICDAAFRVQYVNSVYEKQFNITQSDAVGNVSFDLMNSDTAAADAAAAADYLRKGKEWESTVLFRRKSGAVTEHFASMLPVVGRHGSTQHYVCVRQSNRLRQHSAHLREPAANHNNHNSSGNVNHNNGNRDSGTALQSLRINSKDSGGSARGSSVTIEAPIHKVIKLISAAQEAGPSSVSSTLSKALDILHRSSDLYNGELITVADDKITADYVDGLMSGGGKPPEKKRTLHTRRSHLHRPSEIMTEHINLLLANSANNIQSLSEIPPELLRYLEHDDQWDFDILELERVTDNKPMVYLAMKTLNRFNICQFLQCSEDTMLKWLQVMQDHYHAENCYHNATHGADVMQCSAYFLERYRIKSVFDEMDEAASLLGALVHDLDHPGRTNPFLINSSHRLALLYNDVSVLESHHASLAFQLSTRDDRINIFKNMSREEYKALRQTMIDVVLATEMAKHFEHVGKFANQIVAPLVASSAAAAAAAAHADANDADDAEQLTEDECLELLSKPENRQLIRRVLIKCADISNQCRPLKLCKEWSRRISEEYFQQTDEEKSRGLPIVMPVFDRATCNLPQSQIGFIDFFLKEMFAAWHAFCDIPSLLENMHNNYAYWQQLAAEQQRAEAAMQEVDEEEEEEEVTV